MENHVTIHIKTNKSYHWQFHYRAATKPNRHRQHCKVNGWLEFNIAIYNKQKAFINKEGLSVQ